MAAAQILHLMAKEGKSLSELLSQLPSYYQVKTKLEIDPQKRDKNFNEVQKAITGEKNQKELITIDGYKVVLKMEAGYLIRFSGTEPLVRVFAESKDQEKAQSCSEILRTSSQGV
jgi:phosphomannomutase